MIPNLPIQKREEGKTQSTVVTGIKGTFAPNFFQSSLQTPVHQALRAQVIEIGKTDPQRASLISLKVPTYQGTPLQIEVLKNLGIQESDLPNPPRLLGGMLAAEHLIVGVGKIVAKKAIQLLIDGNKDEVEAEIKKDFVKAKIELPDGTSEEGHHKGGRVLAGGEKEHFYSVRRYFAEATGLGSFISAKARYEGEFLKNVFHDLTGQAKFYIEGEQRFTGCFKEGKRAGPGTLEKYNRESGDFYVYYKGTWREDEPETGTFFSPDEKEIGWIQDRKILQTAPARTSAASPKATSISLQQGTLFSPLAPRENLFGSRRVQKEISSSPLTLDLNSPANQEVEPPIYVRYPNPDDNPLISAQLQNPNRILPVEDRISLLTQCIEYGRLQAKKAAEKNVLLFIGNTGAGKSTTANYLAGCKMENQMLEGSIAKVMVVVPPEQGGTIPEVMPIGHTKVSKTFMPHIETPPGVDQMTYCDCPGFLDNRGAEINIANAVNIRAAIKQAASVKVLILINYFTLLADRGRGLKDVLKICANLFGKPENLVTNKSSLLIGVTNSPLEMTLPSLKKWVSEDSVPFMSDLLDRLFFFDPLDRGTEGTGRWNRQECLTRIGQLQPVPAHDKIFSTVLTDGDENALVQLSEEIGNNIDKALRAKNFAAAAAQLQSLEDLSVIEHIVLERLIRSQVKRIETYLMKYANQFKTHCSMDRFIEAKAVWGEIQNILSHFKKLSSFLENEQLQEYYNGCYEKYERAQKKEEAFQKLLKEAEARSERSESHIQQVMQRLDEQKQEALAHHAEQERQYRSHIQQLQIQIDNITRSYEQAKADLEKERAEREQKIMEKIEELTQSDRLQEASELIKIRDQLKSEYEEKLQEADGDFSLQLQEQELLKAQMERDKKEQQEKLAQELKKIEEQKAQQERERIAAQEREREKAKEIARQEAAQLIERGKSLDKEGKYPEALSLYTQSLNIQKFASPGTLAEAASAFQVGRIHLALNHLQDAMEHLERAYQLQKTLAPGSLDLALSSEAKGQVYQAKKEWANALEEYQKSLEIQQLVSSDRSSVARTYERIGELYRVQGKYEEALANLRKCLQIRSTSSPISHETAICHNQIGLIQTALGDLSAAMDSYQRSLAIEQELTKDSLAVATTCYYMGGILRTENKIEEALEMYKTSCRIRESLSPNSSELASSYHNIALMYHSLGKLPEALEHYKKCLRIEEILTPNSLTLAISYNNVGRVYASQKDYSEAISFYKKSMEIKKELDPKGSGTGAVHHNLGLIYLAQQNYPKALDSFQQALTIHKNLSTQSLDLAAVLQSLGALYHAMKKESDCLNYTLQSLDLYKTLSPNSLSLASSYESAAQAFASVGQLDKSLEHHKLALSLREKLIPNSLPLANTYYAIGALSKILADGPLSSKAKLEESFGFYAKSAEIREKLSPKSEDLALCYERMGDLLLLQKDLAKAKTYYMKSLEIKHPPRAISTSGPQIDAERLKKLELLSNRCRDYSSEESNKVLSVCQLQLFLERIVTGEATKDEVLAYLEKVLGDKNNPNFASSIFRKSTVRTLFEDARDWVSQN
jgi:tetratricopeptide (TPR) repeat protein